eukprot:6191747-Pleurochrysis_carterae.AAC.1
MPACERASVPSSLAVRACVRACERAWVRGCVRACVRACGRACVRRLRVSAWRLARLSRRGGAIQPCERRGTASTSCMRWRRWRSRPRLRPL